MLILETITTGICAYVIFGVLMQPGMLLGAYGDLVHKWYNEWPRERQWLAKPLGYCGACFAGQIGFWWYLLRHPYTWSLVENSVFALQTIFFFLVASTVQNNEQWQKLEKAIQLRAKQLWRNWLKYFSRP